MDDLKITPQGDSINITLEDGTPSLTGGLDSSVYLSLFTGAYWGNAVIGSGFYTSRIGAIMAQEPLTLRSAQAVLNEARRALKWLIDEGIAESVEAEAEIPMSGRLDLKVTIRRVSGNQSFTYALNWDAQISALQEGTA